MSFNYNTFDSPNQNTGYQQNSGYPNINNAFNRNVRNEPPIQTNKWLVTSLQEALSRPAPLGSRGVYYQQDGDYEYEIFTDLNGRKTYEVYKRIACNDESSNNVVSRNEIDELKQKILKLEEMIYAKPNIAATNVNDGNATL